MTNNLENLIRAAEKRNAEAAAARQAATDQMLQRIAEARAEHQALAAAPAELLAAAERGEDVPTAALIEARTAAEIAEKRLAGLEKRAPRGGAQVATNLAGVRAIAPLFEGLVNDVPVIVTSAPSSTWLADVTDADAPAIVLSQVVDTTNAPDGLLTVREIEATFVAPSWAAGIQFLTPAEIESRARAAGIGLHVMSYGDHQRDRIGIEVTAAFEPVPQIASVTATTVPYDFVSRLLTACGIKDAVPINTQSSDSLTFRGMGRVQIIRGGTYETSNGVIGNVTMSVTPAALTETVHDGMRTARVELRFGINFGGTASQVAQNKHIAHNAAKDVAAALMGEAVQGMGRVVAATYEPADDGNDLTGSIVIEYASRTLGA